MVNKKKIVIIFVLTTSILIGLTIFSILRGSIRLSLTQLYSGLFIQYDPDVATVYDLRLPRILISILAGASLSISGLLLQAVMQNPLTDPGIIGISSAASLTSSLVLAMAPGLFRISPLLSILGGLIAYLLLYSLSWQERTDPIRMVLVGVALNMTFTGIQNMAKGFMGGNLTSIQSIIEGNITQKTWDDLGVLAFYGILGLVLSLFTVKACNLLALSDETARSIGVNVDRNRFIVALIAIVLASATTAIVGVISFLGLVVPHIGRIFVGTNHKYLIPYTGLLGSVFLLSSDTLGRLIAYPYEISANVVMTVIGGPFFIALLRARRTSYGD